MKTIATSLILTATTILSVTGQNLISNSSFEMSGQLNCQFWYDGCGKELTFLCDTFTPDTECGAQFYQYTPPGGGIWSLYAVTGMLPPVGSGITYVSGLSGTNIFNLKVWMKAYEYSGGSISFGTFSQGQFIQMKYISSGDTEYISSIDTGGWKQYSLIDTFFTLPTDTIAVRLAANVGAIDFGYAYFDLVQLTIVGSISTIGNENIYKYKISVFPNPASSVAKIYGLLKEKNIELFLYDIMGRIVTRLTIPPGDGAAEINLYGYEAGVYFLKFTVNNELLSAQKLIINR